MLRVLKDYILLNAGGALGKGVGPLLISKYEVQNTSDINEMHVAIPGADTTAHILFSLAFPAARHKHFTIFSAIENSVLNQEADAGVIIHENRFTYHEKGLLKVMDLGEYWEQRTGLPIPLGGIVSRKNLIPLSIIRSMVLSEKAFNTLLKIILSFRTTYNYIRRKWMNR